MAVMTGGGDSPPAEESEGKRFCSRILRERTDQRPSTPPTLLGKKGKDRLRGRAVIGGDADTTA